MSNTNTLCGGKQEALEQMRLVTDNICVIRLLHFHIFNRSLLFCLFLQNYSIASKT